MQHNAIAELCDQCRSERIAYRARGLRISPACADLFRLASEGNQAAWDALHHVLWPECLGWFAHWARDYAWMEPEELAQDVWLKLYTHPPTQPILGDNDISPAIAFLRTCALRRFLMEKRKYQARIVADEISIDQSTFGSESDVAFGEMLETNAGADDFDRADLRLALRALLDRLLSACQQHIIRDVFILKKSRAEVAHDHPECFKNAASVFEATRNVRKKLTGSDEFRALAGDLVHDRYKSRLADASLHIELTLHGEADNEMKGIESCHVPEEELLDYVLGHASAALVSQIERSSACMASAHKIAGEIGQWVPILRLVECPDVGTLVDFFENRLVATQRLVIGRHVQQCPHCQEEMALLRECASVFEPASLDERTVAAKIKALFVSPTQRANALRGDLLQFETDQLRITLDCARSLNRARLWTLSGEVRMLEGTLVRTIREARLTRHNAEGEPADTFIAEVLPEEGVFVMDGVASGLYDLHLLIVTLDTLREIDLDRVLSIGDAFRAEKTAA